MSKEAQTTEREKNEKRAKFDKYDTSELEKKVSVRKGHVRIYTFSFFSIRSIFKASFSSQPSNIKQCFALCPSS